MANPPPYYTFLFLGHSEQGVKAAARILAKAALSSGFKAQAFCSKTRGPGDGHSACTRISKAEIREKGLLKTADFTVFFDPSLLKHSIKGLQDKSVVIINSESKVTNAILKKKKIKTVSIDAYGIGYKTIAKHWPSAALMGALAKAFPRISLKAIKAAIETDFYYDQEQNIAAADEGFRSAK